MSSGPGYKVCLTGGRGTVGSALLPLLREQGLPLLTLGRTPVAAAFGGPWRCVDLANYSADLGSFEVDALIHAAALWLLPDWLEKFHARGVRRLIAFSSTSRFTKQTSASPYEREVVGKLAAAEDRIAAECECLGIAWTIFRPTLIYGGYGGDRNVADIARLINRLGFFPMLGAGGGLRQPVNASDLAVACLQSLEVAATHNKAYNLSGGETLAYIDMVRRIFETLDRRPVLPRIPFSVFRLAVLLARLHPRFSHLTPEMALRMETDLVFDHGDATRDFGYTPGKFDPAYLKNLH
jgi:nucleoside-diphosphate-sugar epimerase